MNPRGWKSGSSVGPLIRQPANISPLERGDVQVRPLLRSHSQGERSRASLAPGLYHPSPSIFSPSWSDLQGAVDDGAITGLRMRRSSAVRRPTPCHFSSLSSLLVHSSLFCRPTTVAFVGGSLWPTIIFTILHTDVKVLIEPRKLHASHVVSPSIFI